MSTTADMEVIPSSGNVVRYLRECRDACLLSEQELARIAGYARMEKFRQHEAKWLRRQRSCPLAYLRAIDVDFQVLGDALERDRAAYEYHLSHPPLLSEYFYSPILGFGQRRLLPHPMTEQAAIDYIQARNIGRCVFSLPGKGVMVYRDYTVTYLGEPGYRIARKVLIWAERKVVVAPMTKASVAQVAEGSQATAGAASQPTVPGTGSAETRQTEQPTFSQGYTPGLHVLRDEEHPPTFLTLKGKRFMLGPSE